MKPLDADQIAFINDWEQDIRASYPRKLARLDALNIWTPAVDPDEQFVSFIFRPEPQARNVDWFVVHPDSERVTYFNDQVRMYQSLPARGKQTVFWQIRETGWWHIHTSAYEFATRIVEKRRVLYNIVEVK